jgi:hypothetical protein
MDHSSTTFLSACFAQKQKPLAFFAKEFIPRRDAGIDSSLFYVFLDDEWYRYQSEPKWHAIAMAAAKYEGDDDWVIMGLGTTGEIWELRPKSKDEKIYKIPGLVAMTNARSIDDMIYICGMGRKVLSRQKTGDWLNISAPTASLQDGVIGFESIDGWSKSSIVAVGWQGEIWHLSSGMWRALNSPTNKNLNAVWCASNGLAYVVGDQGACLVGDENVWEVVSTEAEIDLRDVCEFQGEIFVCSDYSIFVLQEKELVLEDRFEEEDTPNTCHKLLHAGEKLYCVGVNDLFVFDGDMWSRLV